MNETELKQFLLTLHKNLNILEERAAKFGGNVPLDLLNQINDYKEAITVVEARVADEITAELLEERLASLNLNLDRGGTTIISQIIGTLNIPVWPLVVIGVAVLGIFGFAAYRTFTPTPAPTPIPGPTEMKGLFNVAVAEFGEVDATGQAHSSADGQQLSEWIFNGLQLEFESLPTTVRQEFQPLVWHDNIPIQEKGTTIGIIPNEEAAAALAQKIKADIVIYGNLNLSEDSASFVPEFYVAPLRGEAEEIIGRHQLGEPIEIQTPLNLDQQGRSLNRKLISRTRALSRFTIGLMYDLLGESKEALVIFQEATEGLDRAERSGQEIFYYFIGRSALFLDRDKEAETAFETALTVSDNSYARAYIGLGSVHLRRARRLPPDQRLETTDLQQAIESYQKAITQADEAAEPQTKITARLGLGMAYRLQGEAYFYLRDDAAADPLFDQAIAEIQAILEPMQLAQQHRYLGQAYLSLGAAYAQQAHIRQAQGDKEGSIALYEEAREAYANCIAQKEQAPDDQILVDQIIAAGCSRYDQIADEALTKLEGEP